MKVFLAALTAVTISVSPAFGQAEFSTPEDDIGSRQFEQSLAREKQKREIEALKTRVQRAESTAKQKPSEWNEDQMRAAAIKIVAEEMAKNAAEKAQADADKAKKEQTEKERLAFDERRRAQFVRPSPTPQPSAPPALTTGYAVRKLSDGRVAIVMNGEVKFFKSSTEAEAFIQPLISPVVVPGN